MSENIFAKIIAKQAPATIVFEDDRVLAFRDINPQAPVHILILPKKEIARVSEAEPEDEPVLGHLLTVAAELARNEGIDHSGYRLVINKGRDAGESVPHLHVHLLGGRPMAWPPG
jgi:histidine triad (HIT) family protein